MAENEIKHKKNELLSCEKDLSGAVQRELAIKEQEDTKLSVLLAKIKSLDEEVIAGRYCTSFWCLIYL